MTKASFTVAYDGPALRDHTMDVRDLAPALLGFGELFDAANMALGGEIGKTRVLVKALQEGCFQISFEVLHNSFEQIVAFLAGQNVTAAINLKELIGFGEGWTVTGLLILLRWLRGKRPEKVETLPADTVRLWVNDQSLDVPIAVLRLFQDVAVRSAIQKVVEEPLKKEGVETFEVRESGKVSFSIGKDEASFYASESLDDDIITDLTRTAAFSIVSLAFRDRNKWRLNDGSSTVSASIEDEEFLARVDASQIAFAKGDILVCKVRQVQRRAAGGIKNDYTVLKIIEHRPAARQIPLQLQPPPQ